LTDQKGKVAWSATYSAYGKAEITVARVTNNLRLPGQYFDEETGLHYNFQRYYDPDTGRYITADPIGLRGGINLYAYVNANPINYIDPKGLECIIKSLREVMRTGNIDIVTELEPYTVSDAVIDSLPNTFSYSIKLEHKYEKEEWAEYDVLVEVCTDDCGHFISRTPLSALKIKGTEYWVTNHEWQRYRTVISSVPVPVSPMQNPWEQWRKIY
jgi:RHS repeat-associated protein